MPLCTVRQNAVRRYVVSLIVFAVLASVPVLMGGCDAPWTNTAHGPTATSTTAPTEPLFLTTQIAVFMPPVVHPGDAVTVVCTLQPTYDVNHPRQQYTIRTAESLYGPFPSRSALQSAVAANTVGPPTWTNLMPGREGGGGTYGGGTVVLTDSFSLPTGLKTGLYDLAVEATLPGGRALARSDVPVSITT